MKGRDGMLKKTIKAGLLAFALFVSVIMIAATIVTSAVRNAEASALASVHQTGAASGYILRAYNGHIAVFYGDIIDSPGIETTIEIGSLRTVDREKLEKGITVNSYDEVLKLLEDFGS